MIESLYFPVEQALKVAQQAVSVLATWAGAELARECERPEDTPPIARAKTLLPEPVNASPEPLRLLFDRVYLKKHCLDASDGSDCSDCSDCSDKDNEEKEEHYWPAIAIADEEPEIPYPQSEQPTPEKLEELKASVKSALKSLNSEDWQNLSLLGLILEKYGSYLSWGQPDVALADMARSIGAVAAALAHNPDAKKLSLIAGDLSGIQKFIYTISSDGALKSLRARSFYLQLVVEEVVQQLLEALELPRTNVIYAGGGNLYLLTPAREETKTAVNQVREQFNQWLRKEFQGKIFLALDCFNFERKDVSGLEVTIENASQTKFAKHWSDATKQLAEQKSRKFSDQLEDFLKPRQAHEPCRVCHRDDVENLKPLKQDEPDSALACGTCRRMFRLGGQLLKVKAIVRSHRENIPGAADRLRFTIPSTPVSYHIFKEWNQKQAGEIEESETVFLVNDWKLDNYRSRNTVSLLMGKYAQESETERGTIMRAEEMAEKAEGIARLGYLRMDVDRLGLIFAEGLGENQTLPRLAGLSRQMSYFFKVYLNSLAEKRDRNIPENLKRLTKSDRRNLLFIYAGGDDLFVTGAWNEVVEFAFDIYQCFRAYAGHNPDITISGGIEIVGPKYPLYQAADESGDAEHSAKDNGRDSLGLFGEAFKWAEWLGQANTKLIKKNIVKSLKQDRENTEPIDEETLDYLKGEEMPSLFGVFPLVKQLNDKLQEIGYARSFVRNLLATASLQDRMIKEIKEKHKEKLYQTQILDIRYYLHLPKVAYTLARLPKSVRDSDDFAPVRVSLKNPYNAPYFRAIATWLELLKRSKSNDRKTND